MMQRILEPELMEDNNQVMAYAQADFSEPHQQFIDRLAAIAGPAGLELTALDLGCGPGDISRRFVQAYPLCLLHAVDGSKPMLDYAKATIANEWQARIHFIHGRLPDVSLPYEQYDLIFSNSLLHHLPEPEVLWKFIKRYGKRGGRVVVMDLLRPETVQEAKNKVEYYAASEPEILQHDFYHSLLAAFTLDEIKEQLNAACLNFSVEQISDRHVFISGRIT
ncbi:MAG: class I SAM-dependent methyltransferase [Gammaproteobacteria bacterium]